MKRALYPHARAIRWVLFLVRDDYFSADRDFIGGAGELRRRRDFQNEAAEFRCHPANRGILRQVLRLRVSADRLRRMFHDEVSAADGHHPMAPEPPQSAD